MTRFRAIAIGNELLSGDLADKHVKRFGAFLRQRGLRLSAAETVPDEIPAIQGALSRAMETADVVLVTGGLGPTSDDLTVEALSDLLGRRRVEDAASAQHIRDRISRYGRTPTEGQLRQAAIPEGARALSNRAGTAPGVHAEHEGAHVFLFPGVPSELEAILEDHLTPWVDSQIATRPLRSAVFKTFGETESAIASRLEGLDWTGAHVAYRATFPEIHVTVYVEEADAEAGARRLDELSAEVRERLHPLIFGEGADASLARAVGDALTAAGATVALAESCTGGLVAQSLTGISGASAWLLEGLVTYSNASKTKRLDVDPTLIERHGAVSEAVARAMAEGVRARSGSDLGLSITGIAGPSGGTPDKPVGTVHLALATAEQTRHLHLNLPFGRERNRHVSAWQGLRMLLQEARTRNT
ncbi:MAG: damage-inducible protein CinA [Deltaproteobacteria bacterium]|nr:damage-inducible protein CinA [Deltaproteobacteria bacterium]